MSFHIIFSFISMPLSLIEISLLFYIQQYLMITPSPATDVTDFFDFFEAFIF